MCVQHCCYSCLISISVTLGQRWGGGVAITVTYARRIVYFPPRFNGSSKMLSESAGVLLAAAAFFFVSFLALGAAVVVSANMSSEKATNKQTNFHQ